MMNPELKRNLWLSFSTHRLIAMPALLGLTFLAVAMSDHDPGLTPDALFYASTLLFIFIVWLWGARNANSTIVDELRDKTWDQQRMSALEPWAMTWGKLFGSTSYNWYGGVFCLLVAIPAGIMSHQTFWLSELLILIAVGVMIHATLIALNLHTGQLEMQLIQRGGLGWLAIILALPAFTLFVNTARQPQFVTWWSLVFESRSFLLGSAALFAGCAVFAAWRIMCNALQVRTLPWAWPLFAVILAVYFTGMIDFATDAPLFSLGYTGLFIAAAMTYATLFTEPVSLRDWNRLQLRWKSRDWRGWLEHLPLWPTTLLLAFCFALLATLMESPRVDDPEMPFVLFLHEPFALALMLLRDACIVLFFSVGPKAKRAFGVAVLYLVVLDLLLPFLFKVANLDVLSYFFMPMGVRYGAAGSILAMATQAVIAMGFVAWRLNKAASSKR
jgi:hypothetical protein